jgi:hypothetical protein
MVDKLFSKLKSVEVDRGVTTQIESPTDSHSLALVEGIGAKINANPSSWMYSLSSLTYLLDEEFDVLGENELVLLTRRFERMHENRVNSRRNSRTCFQCGKLGHFVANYLEKMENKDNNKYRSRTENKHRFRCNHKNKHKDDWRSRKKDSHSKKARAVVSVSDIDSISAYSTSSSSSSEDEGYRCKSNKGSMNLSGLSCFA